jgi:hypothetical protein
MPAKVDPADASLLKGNQLFGFIATLDRDDIFCMLTRDGYDGYMPRDKVVAGLGSDSRDAFCGRGDDSYKGYEELENKAATNSGYPAGVCAASYIKEGSDKPGRISANLAVAAPAGLYMLACNFSTSKPTGADRAWNDGLDDFVHHMQDSLKLPAR